VAGGLPEDAVLFLQYNSNHRPSSGIWMDYVANKPYIKHPFFANQAKVQNTVKKYYDNFLISLDIKSCRLLLLKLLQAKRLL
jgi:hypothetical protein